MNYNQFESVLFNCKSHATVVSTYNKVQDNINIVTIRLHLPTQIHRTAPFSFHQTSLHRSPCTILSGRRLPVRYDLGVFLCTIRSRVSFVYDINLGATTTTILSTRGVQIPIYLVISATDSFRQSIVLFKSLSIPTSDLKPSGKCVD